MDIKRVKLEISYDGSQYKGFQIQPNKRTVQGEITRAIKESIGVDVILYASGRTDSKVHAIGQIVHFDLMMDITEHGLWRGINSRISKDIYIKEVTFVDNDFHARFNAKRKIYHYMIDLGIYNPFRKNYAYQFRYSLHIDVMKTASQLFIGEHDFRSFTVNKKHENCVRQIYQIQFEETPTGFCIIVEGNGFLQHMVRMIVGSLVRVGEGKLSMNQIKEMLESKGETPCLYKAPPEGLYLWRVIYE